MTPLCPPCGPPGSRPQLELVLCTVSMFGTQDLKGILKTNFL